MIYDEEWLSAMRESINVLISIPVHRDDTNTIAVMVSIEKTTDIALKFEVFGLACVALCQQDCR